METFLTVFNRKVAVIPFWGIMVCICFLAFFPTAGISQTILWSEDWEGNWQNKWQVTFGTWEVGFPNSGPGMPFDSSNCAATVLAGNYSANVNTQLQRFISFVVPSANQNPRLRFWHWFSNYDDVGRVEIKVSGGNWQTISEIYNNTSSGVWTNTSIDLSAYSDLTVQIAFTFVSNNNGFVSSGWYIDDIAVIYGPIVFNNPEDWESGLGDWYASNGTWEVGVPTVGPGSAYNGQQCAATVLGGNYDPNVDSRLISPPYPIQNITENPRLRFWHWFRNYDDAGQVQIRVVGDSVWHTISEIYDKTGSGVWSRSSIDLSSYSNSTVQFAFYFPSNDNGFVDRGWYIDDIEIVTGPIVFNNPEDWESGLGDWYVSNGTWEVGVPTAGPGSAYNGQQCAATVLGGNYDPNVDSRLISPPYPIQNITENPRLRFWHWFRNYNDAGQVQIRVVGDSVWHTISEIYDKTGSGVWSRPSIDLSSYSNSTVQFAFYFPSSNDGFVDRGWYIDDIEIVTGPIVFNNPEDWESGLGDWYVSNGTWEVGVPTAGPGSAYNGQQCAATVLGGNYDPNVDSRLISPPYPIQNITENPRLRFWHWFRNYNDAGQVQIRVVGDSVWHTISEIYDKTGSGVWSRPSIDLSSYSNSTVQFAFYFPSSNDGFVDRGWYIDDIEIVTGPIVFNNPEDWESGLGDWYVSNGTWEVGVPTAGPGSACQGQFAAGTVLGGNYDANVDTRLISPKFNVPSAATGPALRFCHWYNNYDDAGYVEVSVDGGGWQQIAGPYTGTSGGIWSVPFVDLISFADSTVQVAFHFISNNNGFISTGWYVDSVLIVGLSEVTANVTSPPCLPENCPDTVGIEVDMSQSQSPNNLLGSFDGSLSWDPTLFQYDSNSGFKNSFTGAIDTTNVANGIISFTGNNPSGAGGNVEILDVFFSDLGIIDVTDTLDLEFTSMFASTGQDLLPILTVTDDTVKIVASGLLGDVNQDGFANSTDALIILSYDAGLPIPSAFTERIQCGFGDVNGDGSFNSTDGLILLSYDVGVPVPFPVGINYCP